MARPLHKFTDRKIASLKDSGRYSDGGGLYLRITNHGGRSWIFMFTPPGGKRAEIGLGPASALSLKKARELAAEMREISALGGDPRTVIAPADVEAPEPRTAVPLFGDFADEHIRSLEAGWKNAKHRAQWESTLKTHGAPLRGIRVDEIETEDLLAVLRPIWTKLPETANRVRARIEQILDAAKARGFRPREAANPAVWRGHLSLLLPRRSKLSRGHHGAIPWREMPAFWALLIARRSSASVLALQFTILTASRTSEAIGARRSEFDLGQKKWTVPADRIKMSIEHDVPLSPAAMAVLKTAGIEELEPTNFVFPGARDGKPLSNMAMLMLLKDEMEREETVHGFRSSFRDWAGDATDFPRELAEQALAHAVGDATEQAYRRGRAFEKRRPLMDAWAKYLVSEPKASAGPKSAIDAPLVGKPRRRQMANELQTSLLD